MCSNTWGHIGAAAAAVWSKRYRFKMFPDSDVSGAWGRALADTDVILKKRIAEQFDKACSKEEARDADVLEVVTDVLEISMRLIDRTRHQLFQAKWK